MGVGHAIRSLVLECDRHLAAMGHPQIGTIRDGIARWGAGPVNSLSPAPDPPCGGLDVALAAIAGADELRQAIRTAAPFLRWVTYDAYPRSEIGEAFASRHAFASLIGSAGHIHAVDWELGLFLISPATLYRDHQHAAPELYVPLTGPHRWRFGTGSPWQGLPAHVPVWNEPWAVHATLTGTDPFLCLFAWTRDIDLPAKVVHAADWDSCEA
jgi:hypothetical protein